MAAASPKTDGKLKLQSRNVGAPKKDPLSIILESICNSNIILEGLEIKILM